MRIVEFSAFVAAPLGGMTMAQFGAEVIRIDPIGGAIDFDALAGDATTAPASIGPGSTRPSARWRWRSTSRRAASSRAPSPPRPGPGGGIVLTNLPPLPGLDYASLKAARDDVILLRLTGNRDGIGGGRLHGQRGERVSRW